MKIPRWCPHCRPVGRINTNNPYAYTFHGYPEVVCIVRDEDKFCSVCGKARPCRENGGKYGVA